MFKIIWDDLFRSVVDSRLETVLVGWTGVKTFYSHFPDCSFSDSSIADTLDVGLGFLEGSSCSIFEMLFRALSVDGIVEETLVKMIFIFRFVLDAVRKTPDSKMYFFGIAALDRFKTRLKDYPQYCQHVSCTIDINSEKWHS